MLKKIVLLCLPLLFSAHSYAQSLECRYLEPIMKGFLKHHVSYKKTTKNIEQRTVDQYIKRLDSAKLYLYKKDIKFIRSKLSGLIGKLRKSDCDVLGEINKIYIKRVEERADFAKNWVANKHEINKSLEINLDPDTREYAADKAEADKFQIDYMQFQLANFLASDIDKKEIYGMLERRYQRNLKRVKEMTQDELYSNLLDSFAHALDPHSSYFPKDVLEDFRIQMDLSIEGIGATLSSQDGYTVIEQLIPGGAAEASGKLQVKDKIIAVAKDGKEMVPVYDMDLRDVVKLIRGTQGSTVKLRVLRKGSEGASRFELDLVRRKINLEEEAAKIHYTSKEIGGVKKKIAILNLPSFYSSSKKDGRTAWGDLRKLLEEAKANHVDGVVLDLSMNGGGSLDDAVKIAGLFIKQGNVVETARSKLADTDPAVDYAGPLVVLTSRLSASASEIVAGALKDYKRAVIVGGDHTFGKGSVQSVIPLGDFLGAIKVTVGMFFIPGGNSTQHRGVDADIVLPGAFSTDDIGEKTLDYSLPPQKVEPFLSKSAYVKSGEGAWEILRKPVIQRLKGQSEKRVASSEEFKKVIKEMKENQAKKKSIKIADILSNDEGAKHKDKKKLNKEEKEKEYLKRADVDEAVNILVDLISIQSPRQVVGARKNGDDTTTN